MTKIYLAVDEQNRIPIETSLAKKPEFAESEILHLNTPEEIYTAISQPFDLFITLAEYIVNKNIDFTHVNGQIWVIDTTNKFQLENPKIMTFKNIIGLGLFIQTYELVNKEIQQQLTNSAIQTNPSKPPNDDNQVKIKENVDEKKSPVNESPPDLDNPKVPDPPIKEINVTDDWVKNTKIESSEEIIERAKQIRFKAFSQNTWPDNTTIGVWSPIPLTGVSTFVINFAIYLKKYNVPICVVETPNDRQCHRSLLKRYDTEPEGWHSVMETLLSKNLPEEKAKWVYKGIDWLPLGPNDFENMWTKDLIFAFFNNVKLFDFVIVDLPAGKMKRYTLDSLPHLQELWIMIDDDYNKYLAWKEYIHQLINDYKLKVKIIFNKSYSFSRHEEICKELELPLFATLPNIDKESHKNMYQDRPIIDNNSAYQELHPKYELIVEELLGKDYMKGYKERVWKDIKNMLSTKVDSIKRKMILWR